jgi:hypothetical protein
VAGFPDFVAQTCSVDEHSIRVRFHDESGDDVGRLDLRCEGTAWLIEAPGGRLFRVYESESFVAVK